MINLAGKADCDKYILEELRRCGIPSSPVGKAEGEVAYSFTGELEHIIFRRAWSYWVADGLVPIEVAYELYRDEIGKTDIRVSGDCACRSPDTWKRWVADDGRQVVSLKEKAKFEELYKLLQVGWGSPEVLDRKMIFSDTPETIGEAYIECYHIDNEVGLRIFADKIKYLYDSHELMMDKVKMIQKRYSSLLKI